MRVFLVPTRWRGNPFPTRQRLVFAGGLERENGTLARPEWVTTPARGNQKELEPDPFLDLLNEREKDLIVKG